MYNIELLIQKKRNKKPTTLLLLTTIYHPRHSETDFYTPLYTKYNRKKDVQCSLCKST